MARIFAIGDIHGCSKTFKNLLLSKLCIKKSDKVYCLGDYIDRGNDSKGVIDLIIKLRAKGYHIHCLRGNHEQMMMDSTKGEIQFKHWFKNGGEVTLKSFGITSYDKMKPIYKNFFSRTKYFIQTGNFIFVHAGLNFEIQNPFTDKYAMMWIRNFSIRKSKIGSKVVVHGHTPKSLNFVFSQDFESVINIDGGCVYIHNKDFGNLVALNITEGKFITVRNIEKLINFNERGLPE